MKKTLTVNLGGTVFHIDEDAYQLLDKYLSNLRIHFMKEEGTDEIMNDFEMRISELLSERIRLGFEVITIEHVEQVIKRMGKPEEIFEEEKESNTERQEEARNTQAEQTATTTRRRLMRDPDNRILGGVCGGFAAYMNWDPTAVRIAVFLLMEGRCPSISFSGSSCRSPELPPRSWRCEAKVSPSRISARP